MPEDTDINLSIYANIPVHINLPVYINLSVNYNATVYCYPQRRNHNSVFGHFYL